MSRNKVLIALCILVPRLFAKADCPICTACGDVCTSHDGWTSSPPFGCSTPKDCHAVRVSQRYLDSLHPGLFTRTEQFRLVVTEVIPGSPADEVGIVVADKILALNGENPAFSCSVHQWQSQDDPRFADIVLEQHEGTRRHIRLSLVSVRQLLREAGPRKNRCYQRL